MSILDMLTQSFWDEREAKGIKEAYSSGGISRQEAEKRMDRLQDRILDRRDRQSDDYEHTVTFSIGKEEPQLSDFDLSTRDGQVAAYNSGCLSGRERLLVEHLLLKGRDR